MNKNLFSSNHVTEEEKECNSLVNNSTSSIQISEDEEENSPVINKTEFLSSISIDDKWISKTLWSTNSDRVEKYINEEITNILRFVQNNEEIIKRHIEEATKCMSDCLSNENSKQSISD